jgi:hypothetical protein
MSGFILKTGCDIECVEHLDLYIYPIYYAVMKLYGMEWYDVATVPK